MSEYTDEVDVKFDALADKVNRTVEMVKRLKDDKQRLLTENNDLKRRLAETDGLSQEAQQALSSRLASLEKEKTQWQEERRGLARRVEEALTKLEFLESETVPH